MKKTSSPNNVIQEVIPLVTAYLRAASTVDKRGYLLHDLCALAPYLRRAVATIIEQDTADDLPWPKGRRQRLRQAIATIRASDPAHYERIAAFLEAAGQGAILRRLPKPMAFDNPNDLVAYVISGTIYGGHITQDVPVSAGRTRSRRAAGSRSR